MFSLLEKSRLPIYSYFKDWTEARSILDASSPADVYIHANISQEKVAENITLKVLYSDAHLGPTNATLVSKKY